MRLDRNIGLLAIAAVTSCEPSPSVPVNCEWPAHDGIGIQVLNCDEAPIFVQPMDAALGPRIDPPAYRDIDSEEVRIIHPGEVGSVTRDEIAGDYKPGDPLMFWIYEARDGDRVFYDRSLWRSAEELKEADFRVTIR